MEYYLRTTAIEVKDFFIGLRYKHYILTDDADFANRLFDRLFPLDDEDDCLIPDDLYPYEFFDDEEVFNMIKEQEMKRMEVMLNGKRG